MMYRITTNGKPSAVVWDGARNAPLARFKGGVFETNDKAVADKLKALGYTVTTLRTSKKKADEAPGETAVIEVPTVPEEPYEPDEEDLDEDEDEDEDEAPGETA